MNGTITKKRRSETERWHRNEALRNLRIPCGACTTLCETVIWAAKNWNYRKWHKTFREYFDENFPLDKFPQFSESARDSGAICVRVLFGDDAVPCKNMECADCWDMEMQNADLTHGER